MYQLLIVDDEPRIREGLQSVIEWENFGIEVAGTAANGVQAYQFIRTNRPDIVLVDVSMPEMTGIELMEACAALMAQPEFIILSGYNEFRYVQKAIKLGAVDYLLKPIDQDELINSVRSCVEMLDDLHLHRQQFCESVQALRNDTLMRVLTNQISPQEFQKKCKVIDVSLRNNALRVGNLLIAQKPPFSSPVQAVELCQQIFNQQWEGYVVTDNQRNVSLIFKTEQPELAEQSCLETLACCAEQLQRVLQMHCFYALGSQVCNSRELSKSYSEILSITEKKLILGDGPESAARWSGAAVSMNYSEFFCTLQAGDVASAEQWLQQFCRQVLQDNDGSTLADLKYQLIDLSSYVLRNTYNETAFTPAADTRKKQLFSIIRESDNLSAIVRRLMDFLPNLVSPFGKDLEQKNYSSLIRKVLAHVQNNYSDNSLSLKTLAAKLSVNPAYLGREFSLATGEYFNDFLNRIRIDQAIRLLNTTSKKAMKIGEEVGFTNASYFFTIFKKITGVSPNDYRSGRRRSLDQ